MNKYKFWNIIREITSTLLCIYTPYNIGVDVYPPPPPYIDETLHVKQNKKKIKKIKKIEKVEKIFKSKKNRKVVENISTNLIPKSRKSYKHKKKDLNIIEDFMTN